MSVYMMKVCTLFILVFVITINVQGASCPPVVYSIEENQATFPFLAVEVYSPISPQPLQHRYALCTGQEGVPLTFNLQPGYNELFFPYRQEMACTGQMIEEDENCYPTYLASQSVLNFPEIKIPWTIVLPSGKVLATQELCYKVSLNQKKRQPNSFLLTEVEEITCQ